MKLRLVNINDLANRGRFDREILDSPAKAFHIGRTRTFGEMGIDISSEDCLGVDLIRLEAGERFPLHTHPGHHTLVVVSGAGSIAVEGKTYSTIPGDLYIVNGNEPHAVGAVSRHVLLSIGVPHKMPDAVDRMTVMNNVAAGIIGDWRLAGAPDISEFPVALPEKESPSTERRDFGTWLQETLRIGRKSRG